MGAGTGRAVIVVLGDIGRSPRMRFHAQSLASHGLGVDIVGYVDTKVPADLAALPGVRVVRLPAAPALLDGLPRSLAMVLKLAVSGLLLLLTLLFRVGFPRFILLQNPPGLPTLPVCWLVAGLKRCRLVVDWHNYTFSMLQWELGEGRLPVRVAERLEAWFGRRAWHSLCVTRAMRADLDSRWGVKAVTLYDRPPLASTLLFGTEERHAFFHKLASSRLYPPFMSAAESEAEFLAEHREVTALSYRRREGGEAKLRPERPALLVSGTSWTADEDFGLLLAALEKYDAQASLRRTSEPAHRLPPVLAVITGKGPMKSFYLEEMKKKELSMVEFFCPWLESEDYPRMLAAADLGVSLHASTSGLDLPMKVVDMFGCGLPVLARAFPALPELVRSGQNGLLFASAQELADHLLSLLQGFPNTAHSRLFPLRDSLRDVPLVSWEDNWDAVAWPLFQS